MITLPGITGEHNSASAGNEFCFEFYLTTDYVVSDQGDHFTKMD